MENKAELKICVNPITEVLDDSANHSIAKRRVGFDGVWISQVSEK